MRRAGGPRSPRPRCPPIPPGPLPPCSCIQGEGSAAGGGKRGSDAGLAPPLITPRQERLQAPLASAVTAALTPCTQGQGPGADSGLSAAVTFPLGRHGAAAARPELRGLLRGGRVPPGVKLLPGHPQCRWGIAARHGAGFVLGEKGVKGLCLLQGRLSVSHTRAGEHLSGSSTHPAGWRGMAVLRYELRAGWEGRDGLPPSADLRDAQAGCADGVPCPLEKMPVWEFASG